MCIKMKTLRLTGIDCTIGLGLNELFDGYTYMYVTNLYPAKILYCMMVRQFQGILWYGTHQHHQYSVVYVFHFHCFP